MRLGPAPEERAALLAQLQRVDRKLLDEGLSSGAAREPCCPDLHGGSPWDAGTALASGIRQEIAEPPRARTVRQAKAQEPRFIAAAHAEPGKRQIQRSHITGSYYTGSYYMAALDHPYLDTTSEMHRDAGREPHPILPLAVETSVDPIELAAQRYRTGIR